MATSKSTTLTSAQRKTLRVETMRIALFEAAGRVIGRYGYAGCSVARVTTKAKIAHGSFYLCFSSQQELFQEIRPFLGQRMLIEVFGNIGPANTVRALEAGYLQASLAYLKKNPYMFRVMATSDHADTGRDRVYLRGQIDLYVERLRQIFDSRFSDDYLRALTIMISGARSNTLQSYGLKNNVVLAPPEGAQEFYLNFIEAAAGSSANLAQPDWRPDGEASREAAFEAGRAIGTGGRARRSAAGRSQA